MRFYEVRSNPALAFGSTRGYAITDEKISRERLNEFWQDFWDGNAPEREHGEAYQHRYLTQKVINRFVSMKEGKRVEDQSGGFVIERGESRGQVEIEALKSCFPEAKDMTGKY